MLRTPCRADSPLSAFDRSSRVRTIAAACGIPAPEGLSVRLDGVCNARSCFFGVQEHKGHLDMMLTVELLDNHEQDYGDSM